jgi:hypothetical protein
VEAEARPDGECIQDSGLSRLVGDGIQLRDQWSGERIASIETQGEVRDEHLCTPLCSCGISGKAGEIGVERRRLSKEQVSANFTQACKASKVVPGRCCLRRGCRKSGSSRPNGLSAGAALLCRVVKPRHCLSMRILGFGWVDDLGGGLRDGRRLAVQVDGPLGGFLAPDELDMPLLDSALAGYGVALGHASIIAIDDRVPAAELLRHIWSFAAAESCGTCAPCRLGSGRGVELANRILAGDRSALGEQQPLLNTLSAASMCAFGRRVPGSVRSLLHVCAEELSE